MNVALCVSRAMRAAVIAAALVAMTSPGHAQRKPSQADIDIAMEIVTLKGGSALIDSLVPGVVEQSKNMLLQQNPMLQKDLNEVSAQVRTDFAPRGKEVLVQVATAYASAFTEQELKDLLAFYKSPVGKKAVTAEPAAINKGMAFAQEWGLKLSEEVLARIRADMKKKGHDL